MNYIEVYFQSVLQDSYKIERETYIIGRSETADIRLGNKGVSSIHAVIQRKGDKLYIKDLNSTNNTLLNNQKLTGEQALQLGDTLIISKYILKINDWAANASSNPAANNAPLEGSDLTIIAQPTESSPKTHYSTNSYLLLKGDKKQLNKILLSKPIYRIGTGRDSDIQLTGWTFFTPRHIAEIKRVGEVFYITPLKKSYVSVNNQIINNSLRLDDNDKIKIKKLTLRFINEAS